MENKCIVCDIIQGKQKAHIIYEDNNFISFLDIHPLFLGHSLLAPKQHIETFYQLPQELGNELISKMQLIGTAITRMMNAQGSFIAMNNVVSQSIAHLHIHIVPRNKGDGLKGFFWPRMRYKSEEEAINIKNILEKEINRLIVQ